jgi:hypothetical protein
MAEISLNRPLSQAERDLALFVLEHGEPEARDFLDQLESAEVTPWKCPCGCASINFQLVGQPEAPPGVHVLGDFLFGPEEAPAGIFIFASAGVLSGIEVYGLSGEAPQTLPHPEELRPLAVQR